MEMCFIFFLLSVICNILIIFLQPIFTGSETVSCLRAETLDESLVADLDAHEHVF